MTPKFFKTPAELRKWFERNHLKEKELMVGFYKKASGKKSITWPESVDVALCYGWIDSIRKSLDEESYTNRFTPRRARSNWSNINIMRINELMEAGLVHEAGKKAFEKRDHTKAATASYEQAEVKLPAELEKQFKSHKKAWTYFNAQPGSYKEAALWWVISAKQEKTQHSRLKMLIAISEEGVYIKHLQRPVPKNG